MIAGIGIDMASVSRIERLLHKHGERFVHRILTEAEVADCANTSQPARFLAKRFAAKEAFSKAWGTGIGADCGWHDMSIGHDARGKPLIEPNERLAGQLALRRARTHLTLTDEADHALAMVVIEQQ